MCGEPGNGMCQVRRYRDGGQGGVGWEALWSHRSVANRQVGKVEWHWSGRWVRGVGILCSVRSVVGVPAEVIRLTVVPGSGGMAVGVHTGMGPACVAHCLRW